MYAIRSYYASSLMSAISAVSAKNFTCALPMGFSDSLVTRNGRGTKPRDPGEARRSPKIPERTQLAMRSRSHDRGRQDTWEQRIATTQAMPFAKSYNFV